MVRDGPPGVWELWSSGLGPSAFIKPISGLSGVADTEGAGGGSGWVSSELELRQGDDIGQGSGLMSEMSLAIGAVRGTRDCRGVSGRAETVVAGVQELLVVRTSSWGFSFLGIRLGCCRQAKGADSMIGSFED